MEARAAEAGNGEISGSCATPFGERANPVVARIPSALWQGFWTWGFGPWLLFKIRKIHDIHRWRLQTTLVIIFKWAYSYPSSPYRKTKVLRLVSQECPSGCLHCTFQPLSRSICGGRQPCGKCKLRNA